jgi:hypothetical protein
MALNACSLKVIPWRAAIEQTIAPSSIGSRSGRRENRGT